MHTIESSATEAAETHRPTSPRYKSSVDCKCCGGPAVLEGYADFARDCYGVNAKRGHVSGIPIPYYRCGACEFAFTDVFDTWDHATFRTHIYNDDYGLFDPNYASVRPKTTAQFIGQLFPHGVRSVLDYGSGNGATAELLRAAGLTDVTEYDPFHGQARLPQGKQFDLVVCVEVAEHSTEPLALFAELNRLTTHDGAIFLSTKDFSDVTGRWVDDWYVAPRNGHVSFFTSRTLELLARSLGRRHLKVDSFRHLLLPADPSSAA